MTWSAGAGAVGSSAVAVAARGTALTATASRPREMRAFTVVGLRCESAGSWFHQNGAGARCQAHVPWTAAGRDRRSPFVFQSGSEQRNVRHDLRPVLRAGARGAAVGPRLPRQRDDPA